MRKTKQLEVSDDLRRKLAFQRSVLALVKETVPLFSPMAEKALEDIDDIMDKVH